MNLSNVLNPELGLRMLKFTLAVSCNGLNQYILDTFDSRNMRAAAALALLVLMQVIIMIPLNSLVLISHPELRTFIMGFDLIDLAELTVTAVLESKEIQRIESATSAGLVPRSKASAIKASAGLAWVCVVLDVILLTYALHEIGRNASTRGKASHDCEDVVATESIHKIDDK